MIKAVVLAMSVLITAGASQPAPPRIVSMQELTVPADRLPAGCMLSPAPSRAVDGGHVRVGGLWAEFPANPWIGTDRKLIVSIRELIDGPAVLPDGPPLGPKQLSRYLSQLADGVEEAYGVVYLQSEADKITVRALRFAPTEKPAGSARFNDTRMSRNPTMLRIEIGPIVAAVTGARGACFQVVAMYLKSLAI
jgi:hypothetical protein